MNAMRCLVLNAGSSSLKFGVYEAGAGAPRMRLRGAIGDLGRAPVFRVVEGAGAGGSASGQGPVPPSWAGPVGPDPVRTRSYPACALPVGATQSDALAWLLAWLGDAGFGFDGVGHRVVHGGMHFDSSVRVDAETLAQLDELVSLAPLHQPHNLAAIRELARRHPQLPQVACFDTAFHRSNAELVQRYALPEQLHRQGIRRYGFHGLSYQHLAAELAQRDPHPAGGRVIALHLGNGASLCALRGGVSLASSMGFSALDGVPMATRCGQLDPGVVLHLLRSGLTADAIEELLYERSGLLGVSGLSGDMRVLLASPDERARMAVELFVLRVVREIGALAAMLEGVDALAFTGGIGEHAAPVRAAIVARLGWLGAGLDPASNAAHAPRIDTAGSAIAIHIIKADEERVIAADTLRLLTVSSATF